MPAKVEVTEEQKLMDDIDEMLGNGPEVEADPEVEPETEEEIDEGDLIEEKEEEEEVEEDPKPKEEEEEEESEEEEEKDEDADFRTTLNEMAKSQIDAGKPKEKTVEKVEKPEVVEPVKPVEQVAPQANAVRVTEDAFDQTMENAEAFNAGIMEPMQAYVDGIFQRLINAMPAVMANVAEDTVNIRLSRSDFYSANQDLVPYKDLVQVSAANIVNSDPGLSYDEVYEKVEKEVRSKLKLPKSEAAAEEVSEPAPRGKGKKKPAFHSTRGSRKPKAPVLSGQEKHMDDMMQSDN